MRPDASRTVVVGGGVAGASAALRLASQGVEVVLLESSPALGGLVVSFEVGGTPLECFYHHVFPHERHILGLIDELGLTPKLEWRPSSVGVLRAGKVWPFTGPLDLIRFSPLPLTGRVRTGLAALRLGRGHDWRALDSVRAEDWLADACGDAAAEVVWRPLLRAKFGSAAGGVPAAWMWGRFQQRQGARKGGGERLGYLRGGFKQLFDALHARLESLGVDVRTSTRAQAIVVEGGRATGVRTDAGDVEADAVLYAGTLPGLLPLVAPEHHHPTWSATDGLGVVCVVLELDRRVMPVYWTNVCDADLPFGGVIEHTNLVPASDYAGRHVVYLSRYYTPDDPLRDADVDAEAARWLEILRSQVPAAAAAEVHAIHAFRAPYAAPLVQVGHLGRIPETRTHVDGLYLCTTTQIYPQDRGMSDGVRTGQEAADLLAGDLRSRAGAAS